ncbi:MAG: hypothetical protein ABIA04_00550 [Pseudomonadota bacterium]
MIKEFIKNEIEGFKLFFLDIRCFIRKLLRKFIDLKLHFKKAGNNEFLMNHLAYLYVRSIASGKRRKVKSIFCKYRKGRPLKNLSEAKAMKLVSEMLRI